MVEAARKYRRIVQTGTQSRSSEGIRQAVEWVRKGHIGKIRAARGLCYKPRLSIGKVSSEQRIPAHINYDLWCGPAKLTPLMRERLHYDWHWDFETGNGDLGNQGIHQMDIARWFLGETQLSPRVFSVGGRLGYTDDGNTPNTQFVFHDYRKAPLIFEVRGLPSGKAHHAPDAWRKNMDAYKGASVGVTIHCDAGYVLIPDYSKAIVFDHSGKEITRFAGSSSHHANFLQAMRSRKSQDLNADILEGHLSSALCHTGNISYQLGRKSTPDQIRESISGDPDASDTFERMATHLEANGVDLRSTPLTLGPVLAMNPGKETFRSDERANALLRRSYRPGFEVPARV